MRRLAAFALPMSAAIFLSYYLLPFRWLLPTGAVFLALSVLLLMKGERWLRLFSLISLGIAFGFGIFYLHALKTTVPASLLEGRQQEVRMRLLEYPVNYERYSRAVVRLESGDLPKLNAVLYVSSPEIRDAEPGDILTAEVSVRPSDTKYGERYDYYQSRDIYLILNARSEVSAEKGGFDLRTLPCKLHRHLVRLIDGIFPRDTAVFMKSLMLGDKTDLYRDLPLYHAVSRAGLMHVMAVSGMHVAFLVGFLQFLFGNRKSSAVLCILMIWLFVLVTGASPSAVRSGVMQSLLLMAPVLRRENDPVTSLSAALGLILIQNPCSAASVSLQLSFAAMAGILCFGEGIRDLLLGKTERRDWLTRSLTATAASSLAVLPFSIPLMALHFGYVSVLSPLSNLLCLPVVSACFVAGYVACLLATFVPWLGTVLAWLISWGVRYVVLIARLLSGLPYAAVYLQGIWPWLWVTVTYLVFIAAHYGGRTYIGKLLFPAVISALTLVIALNAARINSRQQDLITVHDVGQGQCISILSEDQTLVIDCGGLNTLHDPGESLGAYLKARGRTTVDLLILTHLDSDHVNGVADLAEMLEIRKILLPPLVDTIELPEDLNRCIEGHGIETVEVTRDLSLNAGNLGVRVFAPVSDKDSNDSGLFVLASVGDYDLLVTGDASARTEEVFLDTHPLRDVELLIVGHHGSRYASSAALLRSIGADTAIVSVGYNNYGQPDQETLERIAGNGYNVYRTDESGSIELRIGNKNGEEGWKIRGAFGLRSAAAPAA